MGTRFFRRFAQLFRRGLADIELRALLPERDALPLKNGLGVVCLCGLGELQQRIRAFKNPSLKAKASRSHIVESLTFGKLSVHCSINAEMTALMTITLLEAPAKEEKLPPIRPPEGGGVSFEDFNFKLMVIEELMYRREVLKPRFDVYAFAKRFDERQIDIANEGFDVIPEVRRYFDEYPIPAELLLDIESLVQDGSQVHLQVCPL